MPIIKKEIVGMGRLNTFLFLSVVLFGFLFAIAVPPFQKPDEDVHFYRSAALMTGGFFCKKDQEGHYFFSVPRQLYELPSRFFTSEIVNKYSVKFPKSLLGVNVNGFNRLYVNDTVNYYNYCLLPFVGYIPNTIGMLIGLSSYNFLIIFYSGRIVSLLLFLIVLFICLKIVPTRYRSLILLFSFVPMVLHQVTAYSYDSFQITLWFLAFALYLRIINSNILNYKEILIFWFTLTLVVISKYAYFSLLLLLFTLPYRKKINHSIVKHYLVITGLLIFSIIIIFFVTKGTPTTLLPGLLDPKVQQYVVLQKPLWFLHAIWNSFLDYGQLYTEQFVGKFGWADFGLNYLMYVLALFLLGYLLRDIIGKDKNVLSWKQIGFLLVIIFLTILSIFGALYLYSTFVGYWRVNGVQGRYFFPVFPLIILIASQIASKLRVKIWNFMGIIILVLVFFIAIARSIYYRYYDYSNYQINRSLGLYSYNYGMSYNNVYDVDKISKLIFGKDKLYPARFEFSNKTLNIEKMKLAGFQFLYSTENKQELKVPYWYVIKDRGCSVIIKNGFLDQRNIIVNQKIYTETFFPIRTVGNICISIKPFFEINNDQYFSYMLNDNSQFEFNFIYLK